MLLRRRYQVVLEDISSRDPLMAAWGRVQQGSAMAGIDGLTPAGIGPDVAKLVRGIHRSLRSGRYEPGPVRTYTRTLGGKDRRFGMPNVADRIVAQATRVALQPLLDGDQHAVSFAYVRNKGWQRACGRVERHRRQGYEHVYRYDIHRFFESIEHARLLEMLASDDRIDPRVTDVIRSIVSAPVVRGNTIRATNRGLLLGHSMSPMLANHYLRPLDDRIAALGPAVRYADDGVVFVRAASEARSAELAVGQALRRLGLQVNSTKSRCANFSMGFDFIGYRFCLSGPVALAVA